MMTKLCNEPNTMLFATARTEGDPREGKGSGGRKIRGRMMKKERKRKTTVLITNTQNLPADY